MLACTLSPVLADARHPPLPQREGFRAPRRNRAQHRVQPSHSRRDIGAGLPLRQNRAGPGQAHRLRVGPNPTGDVRPASCSDGSVHLLAGHEPTNSHSALRASAVERTVLSAGGEASSFPEGPDRKEGGPMPCSPLMVGSLARARVRVASLLYLLLSGRDRHGPADPDTRPRRPRLRKEAFSSGYDSCERGRFSCLLRILLFLSLARFVGWSNFSHRDGRRTAHLPYGAVSWYRV